MQRSFKKTLNYNTLKFQAESILNGLREYLLSQKVFLGENTLNLNVIFSKKNCIKFNKNVPFQKEKGASEEEFLTTIINFIKNRINELLHTKKYRKCQFKLSIQT